MSKNRYYYDRITMALDDLLRCKKYCEFMLHLPLGNSFSEERIVYESLFVAFVISYGRVFSTSNTTHKEFKDSVSHEFGNFRTRIINEQEYNLKQLHKQIMLKRNTAIAHSDGNSRNIQHYGDTPLGIGKNPFFPYEREDIQVALELIENLIDRVCSEQSKVGKLTFNEPLFGIPDNYT